MARAKRTDRTEARRRYRAEQAASGADPIADEVVEVAPARRRGSAPAGAAPTPAAPTARPSFTKSMRAAYRPVDVRADLAALPRLLIHWSVLLSAALAVGGTVVFVSSGPQGGSSTTQSGASTVGYLSSMLVSLFVGPPPFGAALLIGFMLPRATWLVGLVFGFLASACFTVIVLAQPAETTAGVSVGALLVQVWLLGPIGTMIFAAAIAWYRRFLDLLNPNRGNRGQKGGQAKSTSGRGNAPRNRLSGQGR